MEWDSTFASVIRKSPPRAYRNLEVPSDNNGNIGHISAKDSSIQQMFDGTPRYDAPKET